jgi:hypothetical protein
MSAFHFFKSLSMSFFLCGAIAIGGVVWYISQEKIPAKSAVFSNTMTTGITGLSAVPYKPYGSAVIPSTKPEIKINQPTSIDNAPSVNPGVGGDYNVTPDRVNTLPRISPPLVNINKRTPQKPSYRGRRKI